MPSKIRPDKAALLRFGKRGLRFYPDDAFSDPDEMSSPEPGFPFRDPRSGDILHCVGDGAYRHSPHKPFDA